MSAPNWTDENEHDPGVTLVELFAFLLVALATWRLARGTFRFAVEVVRARAGGRK